MNSKRIVNCVEQISISILDSIHDNYNFVCMNLEHHICYLSPLIVVYANSILFSISNNFPISLVREIMFIALCYELKRFYLSWLSHLLSVSKNNELLKFECQNPTNVIQIICMVLRFKFSKVRYFLKGLSFSSSF